jgi:hypothetical protein
MNRTTKKQKLLAKISITLINRHNNLKAKAFDKLIGDIHNWGTKKDSLMKKDCNGLF